MKKYKIAQIGTFDIENFGDLLFPDVLEFKIGDACKQIDLFSPMGGEKCFDTKYVFPISLLEQKCQEEKYDLIIVGGGDLIRTDKKMFLTKSLYEASSEPSLELWAYPILLSEKYNIPIAFNAVGTPVNFEIDEYHFIKKLLRKVDYLSFRDTETFQTIEHIGITDAILVPDSVITISDVYKKEELDKIYNGLVEKGIIPDLKDFIVFQHNSTNVDKEDYYNELVSGVREIAENRNILFMPIGYIHHDDIILERIYNEGISNTYLTKQEYKLSPIEMISILENSNGYIGTSMHGAVVSYSYGNPFIILNNMNSKKLFGFSKISGNSNRCINQINQMVNTYKLTLKNLVKKS